MTPSQPRPFVARPETAAARAFRMHQLDPFRPSHLAAVRLEENLRNSASPRIIRSALVVDKPAIYFEGERVFNRRRR